MDILQQTLDIIAPYDAQEARAELEVVNQGEAEADSFYKESRKWAEFANFMASNNETQDAGINGSITSSSHVL